MLAVGRQSLILAIGFKARFRGMNVLTRQESPLEVVPSPVTLEELSGLESDIRVMFLRVFAVWGQQPAVTSGGFFREDSNADA